MKNFLLLSLLLLAACEGYRAPSTSSDPSKMSADTLCYRHAYAKSSRALKEEVAARGLDCRAILDEQPPIGHSDF